MAFKKKTFKKYWESSIDDGPAFWSKLESYTDEIRQHAGDEIADGFDAEMRTSFGNSKKIKDILAKYHRKLDKPFNEKMNKSIADLEEVVIPKGVHKDVQSSPFEPPISPSKSIAQNEPLPQEAISLSSTNNAYGIMNTINLSLGVLNAGILATQIPNLWRSGELSQNDRKFELEREKKLKRIIKEYHR
jgi:hypothetical protein